MSPGRHEEADTRICVHARHATQEGSTSLLVKASDTYILVIAISVMPTLQAIGLSHLLIVFGQSRNMRWIPAHELHRSIGSEKDRGITLFHAFISCDVFDRRSQYPPTVNDNEMDILEKSLVMMDDKSSTATRVYARLDMFAGNQRSSQAIPPTISALLQHVNRAAYQGGCM